jgi:hypothetical protein
MTTVARNPAPVGPRLLTAGAALVLVATLVTVGVAVASGRHEPRTQSPVSDGADSAAANEPAAQPPAVQPALAPVTVAHELHTWSAPGSDLTQTIGLLDGGLGGSINLIEPGTGRVVGTIEVGYGPWALFRRAAEELLIAHQPLDAATREFDGPPVLVVVDLATLQVKREIPLPLRRFFTTYWPGMTLTPDERFLFYMAVDQQGRCTSQDGAGPAGTGGHCDHHYVGTVDLAAHAPAAALARVPLVNCESSGLVATADNFALVTCVDGTTFAVDARQPTVIARLGDALARPRELDPVISANLARVVASIRAEAEGAAGVLFSNGQFLLRVAGHEDQVFRPFPDGASPWIEIPPMRGDQLVLPYREAFWSPSVSGVSIFEWRTGRIIRTLRLPPARTLHILDDRAALALLDDGTIARVELETGSVSALGTMDTVSDDANFLP